MSPYCEVALYTSAVGIQCCCHSHYTDSYLFARSGTIIFGGEVWVTAFMPLRGYKLGCQTLSKHPSCHW